MPDKKTIDLLKNSGIENYLFESKIIEEHVRKYNLELPDLDNIIKRRINREPLQYILGEWEFYGDLYKLNKSCLIPRPETEFITEYIINNAKINSIALDLCSGSGCISISALKRRKDMTAILIDISPEAVNMSKENAGINGVSGRTEFYCLDIMKDYLKILEIIKNKINIIVSNPPYLNKSDIEKIKREKTELYHEPRAAFYGGEDGLDFYRFIIDNYSDALRDNNIITIFECGLNQSGDIIKMFEKIGFSWDIIRDYGNIERVVIGRK
ncbi:MAG: peptide chain release factor N(5)-glutamine methyltransferase [Oscillospiraceae bacterium]|nr:peptide chain release factor N(5)-glutamine methyltransferase [Oscillospiraceae bacterium]